MHVIARPKRAVAISGDLGKAKTPPALPKSNPGEGGAFPGGELCVIRFDLVDALLHGLYLFRVAMGKVLPLADVVA